jgi:hypothetical protein
MTEVDGWMRNSPDRWFDNFNNFFAQLPNGSRRMFVESLGLMKKTPRRAAGLKNDLEGKGKSTLFLDRTYREFFETIDAVLDEVGVPRSIGTDFHNAVIAAGDYEAMVECGKKFHLVIIPAYLRLRQMGYSVWDLTS